MESNIEVLGIKEAFIGLGGKKYFGLHVRITDTKEHFIFDRGTLLDKREEISQALNVDEKEIFMFLSAIDELEKQNPKIVDGLGSYNWN